MKFNIGKVLAALFLLAFVAVVVPSSPAAVGPGGGGVFVPGGGAATNIINYFTPAVVNASATNVPAGFPATVSVTGTNVQTWVFGIPVGRDGTNGVNGINGTNGTGLTAAQTATLNAAVTNGAGGITVISFNDYHNLYVTDSTNSLANGRYTWAHWDNTNSSGDWLGWGWMTNDVADLAQRAKQLFSPVYTNANGFCIFLNQDISYFSGSLGLDYVLTSSTNVNKTTWSELCYVNGKQTYCDDPYGGSATIPNVAVTWNTLLSDIQYEVPPFETMYGAPYPTVKWGTNTITNIANSLSFGKTNRVIYVNPIGDDSTGTIGDQRHPFKTVQMAQAIATTNGNGFVWNISKGRYWFENFAWFPSNAVIYCESGTEFYNPINLQTSLLYPCGDVFIEGGRFYEQLGRAGGPICGIGFSTTNLTFNKVQFFSDHGTFQGAAPGANVNFLGCEIWSGSWTVEMIGSASKFINVFCHDLTIHQNSWHLNQSSVGMYPFALGYANAHIAGCSMITSNGYPQTFVNDSFIHEIMGSTNTIFIAGTTAQHIGSNTNWWFIDATNSAIYWNGTRWATNRLRSIPMDSQQ